MQRIVLIIFRMFFRAIYYFTRICWYASKRHINYEKDFMIIKKACRAAIKAARVTIEVEGVENIPKEDGFIFYPNHQGMFDVLMLFESSTKPFAFVIKKEASKVILLKQIIAGTGSYVMDREDMRQSVQVISDVAREVKTGRNFIIFAEGTRSKNGNQLLEFKGGSFKAAYRAQCPVVPCALIDSYKPFDEKGIRPLTAKLIYLPPIPYEEYKDWKAVELAGEVKKRIEKVIAEKTGENKLRKENRMT